MRRIRSSLRVLEGSRADGRRQAARGPDKNRVAALAPAVTLPLAAKQTLYGLATVRYQWEFGARTTTEGGAWNVLVTFLLKPIKAEP